MKNYKNLSKTPKTTVKPKNYNIFWIFAIPVDIPLDISLDVTIDMPLDVFR